MAYEIGFVDNTGSEGLAHWQMLEKIRRFALGYGTAAAPVYAGTGNGTLTGVDTYPATVSETWTITCTVAGAGATFSVVGSVSGAKANATAGVAYDNALLKFLITAGATLFAVGDKWTIAATVGALPAAQRWTQLRYTTPTDGSNRELILQGVGLSGTEQVFIGFRSYHNVASDYYNLTCAGFTGYVADSAFTAQPGYFERGVCAHNNRIDYWLAVNAQRVMFGLRMSAPLSYEPGYAGKFFAYATPGEYPYPLLVAGTLSAPTPATRYSDTTAQHSTGLKGCVYNAGTYYNYDCGRFRDAGGVWRPYRAAPWTRAENAAPALVRDTGGYYAPPAVEIMTRAVDQLAGENNVWGVLDGVRYISGFNNQAENTGVLDGKSYVVMADTERNGIGDYLLLEMN